MDKSFKNKLAYLILFFILGFAFIVRIWNVSNNPAGFFCDEASIGYNAYSVLTTGRDEWGTKLPLLFKAFGQYTDPVYIYSDIPLIKLFGLSEFSVRLASVFYGTLAVLAIFLLSGELFNLKIGLLAALLLAISPWHIHFSRIGFELISATFWLPFSLFLFLKSLKNFKKYYFLTILSSSVTFFTYYPIKIIWPLLLLATFFIFFSKTKHWLKSKRFWLTNAAIAVVFVVLMLPYLKNNSFLSRWIEVKNSSLTFGSFLVGYWNHFSWDFLFKTGDIGFPGQFVTRHSVKGLGELYVFELPLIVLGLSFLVIRKKYREFFLLLFFLLFYPLGTVFTDIKPQATRSIIGVIPFQIVSAYGLGQLVFWVKGKKLKLLIVLVFLTVAAASFFNFLKLDRVYPDYSADFWGWQYGPKEIVDYFRTQTKNYDGLYMTGYFNAPEIFLKFYDPNHLCKNCFIGGIDRYDAKKKQLFALRVEETKNMKFSYRIKKIIYYPDGKGAFYIIEPNF